MGNQQMNVKMKNKYINYSTSLERNANKITQNINLCLLKQPIFINYST